MSTEKHFTVGLALTSPNLIKKLNQIINASGGFEVVDATSRHLDLLVLQLAEDTENGLKAAAGLLNAGEVSEVFLTAESVTPEILMKAMRAGVKEFITQPFNEPEILDALKRFKERRIASAVYTERKNGQIISVFGSKGGVGTTTVAVNLAVSLAQNGNGNSIALLDMNTLFGEIPLFLEIAPKFNWGEITKNIDRLDETFLSNILAQHRSGVKVLPSPAYLNGHVRPTPDIMGKLLTLMKRMFDFVIIDAGQSTNDSSMKVLQISDTLMLISVLSLPCLANTNKLLKSLSDLGYISPERIKVILNRYTRKGEIPLKDAEAGIGREVFTIPNDYNVTMAAINNGKPLLEIAPRSEISKRFQELAASLNSRNTDIVKKKKSLFFGLS